MIVLLHPFLVAPIVSVIIFVFSVTNNEDSYTKSQWWLPIVCNTFVFLETMGSVIYQIIKTATKYDPAASMKASQAKAVAAAATESYLVTVLTIWYINWLIIVKNTKVSQKIGSYHCDLM